MITQVNKVFAMELNFEFHEHTWTTSMPIHCPECECDQLWVKTHADTYHSLHPPRLICTKCNKQFYPHTSLLFQSSDNDSEFQLLEELFLTSTSLNELSQRFGASITQLSQFKSWFLHQVKEELVSLLDLYRYSLNANPSQIVIYMDGMFIRVGNSRFVLMLATDHEGHILSFAFTRAEDQAAIQSVLFRALTQIGHDLSEWCQETSVVPSFILVTDGRPVYRKLLLELQVNCLHIAHIHQNGSQLVTMRLYQYSTGVMTESIFATAIDAFNGSGVKQVRFSQRTIKPKPTNQNRGRPLGAKNKPKPPVAPVTLPTAPKKRGPKNPWATGRSIYFSVDLAHCQLSFFNTFSYASTLCFLLSVFGGQCLTSNPVE